MSQANLSVIVTNWNKPASQLAECMNSIKMQTVEPKEIILIDDCSKNPKAHALAISVILPKNVGVAKARDFGVQMSTGKLILFVDADDLLAPDFIQQCGKQITKADIVYPNMILFDGIPRNKLVENPSKITAKYLLGRKTSIPVTSMMWRRVYDDLGGFNPTLPIFEDWDFWIRALCKGYTFRRANTLLWYRQNPDSRNHGVPGLKESTHTRITAPYKIIDGKIQERRKNGIKETQAS